MPLTNQEIAYDVVVIGGGPAGSTIATLLTQGELRVVLFEREHFPRFHVGKRSSQPIYQSSIVWAVTTRCARPAS